MKALKKQKFEQPIILTKVLDDKTLLTVDSQTTIRFLDKNKLGVISGFKAKVNHLRYKNSVVAFSNDGKYFVTMSADCRESRLYNAKTKKIIAKVDRHHGEVSCVAIDNSGRYMFSCGDDGKTFVVDIKSGKLAFTLPAHADTVNDIVFSSNKNWVATVGYDKKVSIFHLSMMTPKHRLKIHSAAVMKAVFIGQKRFCSVDKNSSAIVLDIYTGKILKRLEGIHDDVVGIVTGNNDKFLFFATVLGYIIVYDTDSYKQLSRKYIKVKTTITSIEFDKENNHLIISCEDGDMVVYDIYEGESEIVELLKEKKYENVYAKVKENPLLEYTKSYEALEKLWENTLSKAIIYLQKNDKNKAAALFSYFKAIPSKNKIIQKTLSEYIEFDKFAELAKKGKVALAYSVVNKYPSYKESKLYKSLEVRWKERFALAQKYALEPNGIEKAREILAPYRGVSEKTKFMQEIFTQGNIYKRFISAIGHKDFKLAFELLRLHPFLKEFPEYNSLNNYGDTLYIKAHESLNSGDTISAIKILNILINFSDFTDDVKTILAGIELKNKFQKAIEDKDISLAYNIIDSDEDIQITADAIKLKKQWESDLNQANIFASKGDVKGAKESLDFYMEVSSKHMSIASVFGWCYMVQLEKALKGKEDSSLIERGIKNYIASFGLQDQMVSFYEIFLKRHSESKLDLEPLMKGSLKTWKPSMIEDRILD